MYSEPPNPNEGPQACKYCQKGFYQDELGLIACKYCPNGKWSDETGLVANSQCKNCSKGSSIQYASAISYTVLVNKCADNDFSNNCGRYSNSNDDKCVDSNNDLDSDVVKKK
jgi:hypothetical protein